MKVKVVSSLEKIRGPHLEGLQERTVFTALPGETVNFQLAVDTRETPIYARVEMHSQFQDSAKLYAVKNVVMDVAKSDQFSADDDYLTAEGGMMPDLLLPIAQQDGYVMQQNHCLVVWCEVSVPRGMAAGAYDIDFTLDCTHIWDKTTFVLKKAVTISVLPQPLPQQSIIFTQWFHVDCIADVHQVPIYSEAHWQLIGRYMKMAAELGINMILTPVITPPLDTAVGARRPCTQLVKIEKNGETYTFDFSLLKRWIALALQNGMQYFEISHLFSQWGLAYSPNILIWENGEAQYLFGWHVKANDMRYRQFLEQFLPALLAFLKAEGVDRQCVFHISDEPSLSHLEAYRYACDIVKPYLSDAIHMDAISEPAFYDTGLIQTPVCATNEIEPFIERKIDNLWAYYCCGQGDKVGNRFLAMPSYRNRILGLQLYKYNIKGFLQWGYNFYYSQFSLYPINPYVTTSADGAFPSGDPFSVYPGKDGPLKSLRAAVFHEALQDIEVCRCLEQYIGHKKVVGLIEQEAGMEITFSDYPRDVDFIPAVMEKLKQAIQAQQIK